MTQSWQFSSFVLGRIRTTNSVTCVWEAHACSLEQSWIELARTLAHTPWCHYYSHPSILTPLPRQETYQLLGGSPPVTGYIFISQSIPMTLFMSLYSSQLCLSHIFGLIIEFLLLSSTSCQWLFNRQSLTSYSQLGVLYFESTLRYSASHSNSNFLELLHHSQIGFVSVLEFP
jgi:hypothetical protein